ncbi:hypothetical protein [Streptomyces sp. NPDC054961]
MSHALARDEAVAPVAAGDLLERRTAVAQVRQEERSARSRS